MMKPFVFLLLALLVPLHAKKQIVFDENQGIIWVDQNNKSEKKGFDLPEVQKKKTIIEETTVLVRDHVKTKPLTAQDYRDAGSKFYFSNDYAEAVKYFQRAWDKERDPTDYFWMGACYRKIEKYPEMEKIFKEILDQWPKSDVADDALFYLAVDAQRRNDYALAYERYRQVVEFYPEGFSLVGKFGFREEAKGQLRAMKVDLLSRLKLVGYSDDNAPVLLKAFQADHDLPTTGEPDQKTVELLVKLSDEGENVLKDKVAANESLFNAKIIYYGIICFLMMINIFWGFRTLRAIRDEQSRMEVLLRELK